MHELAIARAIIDAAERSADGLPVAVVRVRVGRLRQVVPESLAFYFDFVAEGTGCEGAKLEWERIDSRLRCAGCATEWDPAPPPAPDEAAIQISFRCPSCQSSDHSVVSGDELIVDEIEVEDPVADPRVAG